MVTGEGIYRCGRLLYALFCGDNNGVFGSANGMPVSANNVLFLAVKLMVCRLVHLVVF